MKCPKQRWLKTLASQQIIEQVFTDFGQFYRLCAPLVIGISRDMVAELKREYDAGREKGGLFLFQVVEKKNKVKLKLEKIQFIRNLSEDPRNYYFPDTLQWMQKFDWALENNLIPCSFHTHPTEKGDLVRETYEYHFQMQTSTLDKIASGMAAPINDMRLRLPEFLVICNGTSKIELFVGVYGGLVASYDFTNRKGELMSEFGDVVSDSFSKLLKSDTGKIIACLGTAFAVGAAIKYRRSIPSFLYAARSVVPSIAYGNSEKQKVFGITHGEEMKIQIPKLDDAILLEEERRIMELATKENEKRTFYF